MREQLSLGKYDVGRLRREAVGKPVADENNQTILPAKPPNNLHLARSATMHTWRPGIWKRRRQPPALNVEGARKQMSPIVQWAAEPNVFENSANDEIKSVAHNVKRKF